MAVAGGSFVALLSLFHHVPVTTAALRGGATWFVVLVAARIGSVALAKAAELDRAAVAAREGVRPRDRPFHPLPPRP